MVDFFSKYSNNKKTFLKVFFVLVIFSFYLLTRFFLFSREGIASFGYDTGIYRHHIDGYFARVHDSSITPFAFSGYSNFLKAFGVSTDQILITWYFAIAVFLFFIFFFFVKTYTNTSTAILAIFLFSISIIQYEFFWWFYYRNFLAFSWIFLCLIFFHFRSFLVIFPLVALGSLHVLTLLPIGLTMLFLCCIQKENRRFYAITGGVALAGIIVLNFQELFGYFVKAKEVGIGTQNLDASASELSGQFIDGWFFFKYSFLYLLFGIFGFFTYYKKYLEISLLTVVSFFLLISGILFYRRFFVFLDVFSIFFASIFFYHIWKKYPSRLLHLMGISFFCYSIWFSSNYIFQKNPLFTRMELQEVQRTNEFPPARLLAISSATAPWLYGFTHHKVIAPGVFEENVWNRSEWEEFWITPSMERRHELLNSYPSPLYIFVALGERGFESILRSDSHFVQKQTWLWEYIP